MGGDRRLLTGLLATAMVLGLAPLAPSAQASSDGCGSSGCHLERAIAGDAWTGRIDVVEEATIEAGSTIQVTLSFDNRTDRSGFLVTLEDREDGSLPLGTVVWVKAFRDSVEVRHEPIVGGPVSVEASPVGELAWDRVRATIQWNVDQTIEASTYRLVATGPTADAMGLALALDSDASMDLLAEASGASQGALVAEEGWQPATRIDAPGLKVLRDGQASLAVPDDRRLYAYHGPATGGAGAFDACFLAGGFCGAVAGAGGTNWGHSVFGLERPDGTSEQREISWPLCTFATCPAGSGESHAFSLVDAGSGAWTFTVAEHRGAGTAPNMIAIAAPVPVP